MKRAIICAAVILFMPCLLYAYLIHHDVKKEDEKRLGIHFDFHFQDAGDSDKFINVYLKVPETADNFPLEDICLYIKTKDGGQLYTSLTQPSEGKLVEREGKQYLVPVTKSAIMFRASKATLSNAYVVVVYASGSGSSSVYSIAVSSYYEQWDSKPSDAPNAASPSR
ncbi:MAG: hypothetical protein WCG79_03000 [Verrucomicrobiota bacterium]|jgi:hypothetical protein